MGGMKSIFEVPRKRHFKFVGLSAVTHVEPNLGRERGPGCALARELAPGPKDERPCALHEARVRRIDLAHSNRVFPPQRRANRSPSAQQSWVSRKHHVPDTQIQRELGRVHWSRPAKTEQYEIAGIETALYRDHANGALHVGIDDLNHASG